MISDLSTHEHGTELYDLPMSSSTSPDCDNPDPNNSAVPNPECSADPSTVLTEQLQISAIP